MAAEAAAAVVVPAAEVAFPQGVEVHQNDHPENLQVGDHRASQSQKGLLLQGGIRTAVEETATLARVMLALSCSLRPLWDNIAREEEKRIR